MKRVALAVVLIACKKPGLSEAEQRQQQVEHQVQLDAMKGTLAKYRPKLVERRAAETAVIAEAAASPRITTRASIVTPPSAPLVLTNRPLLPSTETNTEVVSASPHEPKTLGLPLVPRGSPAFDEIDRYLAPGWKYEDRGPQWTVLKIDPTLDGFLALDHLLVTRIYDYQPGAVQGDRFVGAVASGDAQLYDLATRARIGAFPFEIHQRDEVKIAKHGDQQALDLEDSFRNDVLSALGRELTALAATQPGPSDPHVAAANETARFGEKILSAIQLNMQFAASAVQSVDIAPGKPPIVTVHAKHPDGLVTLHHLTLELVQLVTDVLGMQAEIRLDPPSAKLAP